MFYRVYFHHKLCLVAKFLFLLLGVEVQFEISANDKCTFVFYSTRAFSYKINLIDMNIRQNYVILNQLCIVCLLSRLVFTSDRVVVGVIIRNIEQYNPVQINRVINGM